MSMKVAVVGAGWAGLSCAHYLLEAGAAVSLFEAAPIAGGRARNASIVLAGHDTPLDNGQHLFIGAYRETLALLRHYGSEEALSRQPLQFESKDLSIRRRGPGRAGLVWGFLSARGLDIAARLALGRMGLTLMRARWLGFEGSTVADLLHRTGQPANLVDNFWSPLCVASMNTDTRRACGQTFVNVLHDAMFQSGASSDFLIAQRTLGELLPEPMVKRMQARGLRWHCPDPVKAISKTKVPADSSCRRDATWQVVTRNAHERFDAVVLATPPWVSAALLGETAPAVSAGLATFEYEAIRTVYLSWPAQESLQLPAIAMLARSPADEHFGEWIFDRGASGSQRIGAVVISVAAQLPLDNRQLALSTARQVAAQLNLPEPADAFTVNEKRATFVCSPDRPVATNVAVNDVAMPANLLLAGDYCVRRYPATLESAVISGRKAAGATLTGRVP